MSRRASGWEVVAFLDDDPAKLGRRFMGQWCEGRNPSPQLLSGGRGVGVLGICRNRE